MKKYIITFGLIVNSVLYAQNPEIKSDLPTILPPSPSVAALMKFEEVPVSNYTGIPDVSIPLHSENLNKNLNLNISLKYHPSSTKVKEIASDVGLGWSLIAGGSITRTIRDMPDEYYQNGSIGIYRDNVNGNNNNYYKAINKLQNFEFDSYEYREYFFTSDSKGIYDTKHDLWQFNFLDYSGRFIVVKNNNNQLEVKMLENSTLKIYPVVDTINPYKIISFNVYDHYGNNYKFDVVENSSSSSFSEGTHQDNSDFSNPPSSYSYISTFHLSKITDTNNNLLLDINFYSPTMEQVGFGSYTLATPIWHSSSRSPSYDLSDIKNSCANFLLGEISVSSLYLPFSSTSINTLSHETRKIQTINIINKGKIEFEFVNGREDERYINRVNAKTLDKVIVKNTNNEIINSYKLIKEYKNATTKKMFLKTLQQVNSNNDSQNMYNFSYKEPILQSGAALLREDLWGYFKEDDLHFNSREADTLNVDAFTLQKMDFITGGSVLFDYESNNYSHIGEQEITNFEDNIYNFNTTESFISINSFNQFQNVFTITNPVNKLVVNCLPHNLTIDWLLDIYKNGVLFKTIMNGSTNENSYKISYKNFPIGNYTVKLRTPNLGETISVNNPFKVDFFIKTLKNENELEHHNYGGGFRIKKIYHFDELSNNLENINYSEAKKVITYNYNFFNSNKSSGALNGLLPTYQYNLSKTKPVLRGGCQSQHAIIFPENKVNYLIENTTDIINKNPTQGSEVGYKNIRITQKNNGYSDYTYTNPIDYQDTILGSPPELNLAPISFEYKRGLLINEKNYNNLEKLLTESNFNYTFEETSNVSGLNIFGLFDETKQSNPVYKLFSNYNHYLWAKNENHCDSGSGYIYCSIDFHWNTFKTDLDIGYQYLYDNFGWAKLASKNTKNYFYPNGSTTPNIVKSNETFTYNSLNKQIASHTVDNSVGDILTTNYFYHTGNSTFSQNRISEIERIETKRGTDLLSESKINYSNAFAGNQSYLPSTIEVKKGSSPSEVRLKNNAYDKFGHVLEVQQESGIKISYIYGYNNTQPVAKLENIAYSAIPNALITAIQTATNDTAGTEGQVIDALNALRTSTDVNLKNAMITTITYKPLIGVSTVTDPKGNKQTYHYDSFNRLKFVKDSNSNILSENEYHYKN